MNPNTKQEAVELIVECKKKSWEQNPLASRVLAVLETAVNEPQADVKPPARTSKVPLVLVALLAGIAGAVTNRVIQSSYCESALAAKNSEIAELRVQNKNAQELLTKSVLSDADAVKAAVTEARKATDAAQKASEGMKAVLESLQTNVRLQSEAAGTPPAHNPAK